MRLRRLTVSLAFLMLLLAPGSAAAQTDSRSGKWSGNLDVSTGLGIHFLKDEGAVTDTLFHLREQVALQVAYTTPTFSVSTQAQGSFVKNETRTIRTTFKEEREMELIGRGSQCIRPGSSVRSNFSWRPSPKNQYTAFLAYQYGYDHTNNLTSAMAADTAANFRIQASDEKRRFYQYTANAGWRSSHQLGSPRLTLLTAGEWKNVAVNKQSIWSKALFSVQQDKDENYMIVYRLMLRTNSNDGMTSISLRDTLLTERTA